MTATMTTTELAAALDTTPRELRKFLRADAKDRDATTPGKGGRYSIPASKREVASLTKRFRAWDEARKAPVSDEAPEAPESDNSDNED